MRSKKYFGTDGIRGQVGGEVIHPEFMLKLGWAAGKVLAEEGMETLFIAKDTRISGDILELALITGLNAAGMQTVALGILPTPAVAFLAKDEGDAAGIVISASHNGYQDNGVKFFGADGMKLSDEAELAIEEKLAESFSLDSTVMFGKSTETVDAAARYIDFCIKTFPEKLNLKKLKIVVDCANGATYQVAPEVFRRLEAEVVIIANQPDGMNINDGCGAVYPQLLQKTVLQQQADVGIALDGDGDRLIMVDSCGEVVDGDELLYIIALGDANIKKKKRGVVGTVMSNLGLEQALKKIAVPFKRAPVGDRYVLAMMQENDWLLGGEPSGHIVDLQLTTTGDGIVSALQVLKVMVEQEKTLSQLKQGVIKQPNVLINVTTKHRVNPQDYPELLQQVQTFEQQLGERGRIVLRPSGTEPVLRVMVEGENEQLVQSMAQDLASLVRKLVG